MEDAATAEISRTQVWQWVRHKAKMADGKIVAAELVKKIIGGELEKIRENLGVEKYSTGRFPDASQIFEDMSTRRDCPEF